MLFPISCLRCAVGGYRYLRTYRNTYYNVVAPYYMETVTSILERDTPGIAKSAAGISTRSLRKAPRSRENMGNSIKSVDFLICFLPAVRILQDLLCDH
jgi:hypothetical protein